MSKHICAACRHLPATLYCAADAAFLCADCDTLVHTANKLARRHERHPIPQETHHPSTTISADTFSTHTPLPDSFQSALASFADACVKREAETLFASASGNHFPPTNFPWISSTAFSIENDLADTATATTIQSPASSEKTEESMRERLKRSKSVTELEKAVWGASSLKRSHSDGSFPEDETLLTHRSDASSADDAERTEEQKRHDRQAALKRFRSKRANRSFQKKVRYECRKQLADSRPRVKGRFVGRTKMSSPALPIRKGTSM